MIRAHPLDGVVLLGNCDKTTPAQMMGAASANVPAIMLTGGPHLSGRFRVKAWAPAPTADVSGPSTAPARSMKTRCASWRKASIAQTATAR